MEAKELYTKINSNWEQMKSALEQAETEKKQYGEALQETKNKIEAYEGRIAELEAVAVKFNRPGFEVPGNNGGNAEGAEAKSAFLKFARKGEQGMGPDELKLLSTDSSADGGYLMPVMQASTVIQKLIEFSPIRELADVVTISMGDSMDFPAEGSTDFAGGWVAERGTRSETVSGKLRNIKITAHEMYANPFITQKLLDDNAFNVEAWINGRLADRFAVIEGTAFLSGDGSGQPEGILTNADIATVNSGGASALTAAGLIDLVYALPEKYARNATFLAKRATIGAIRKLTDPATGQFLWAPGLSADAPATILGRPYREAVDMPAVASSAKAVLFGDFKAAYRILDRQGLRVVRDIYSNKPNVEFYTTRRVGGAVVLPEAMKIQVIAA